MYSLTNIVRVVKSRRMRWAGHVARMGEGREERGGLFHSCFLNAFFNAPLLTPHVPHVPLIPFVLMRPT